jgi:CubicO group peptidase (beta-lactamase class C family)
MKKYDQLDQVLEDIISRWDIPGLAVGLIEEGEIVHTRTFGVQSLATGVPLTPDSLFCVASIAKCIVACAVMQLVEQDRLCLDAPLVDYLPDFLLDDTHYQEITLRQVLSHTSGMPDMDEIEYDQLVIHPENDEEAPARYVRALANRKMVGLPGERFAYSNIAYNVLGYLIAAQTGKTFEDTMKVHLLNPAGMTNSTFFFPDVPLDRLAVPHLRIPQIAPNPVLPYHRADAPASFLYTTVVDMCHWAITSLNRGIYKNERVLSPASYDLMWTPVAKRGNPPFREEMGLGWALGHFMGARTVAHGGGGFGWTCHLILLPEKNRAAIILCNEESSAIESIERAVMCALLEGEAKPGPVSWLIPISHALHTGGIQAAFSCYERIKDRSDYFFDEYDLITMVYQLLSVGKTDLAIDVLKLNLIRFPEHRSSITLLERLNQQQIGKTQAEMDNK